MPRALITGANRGLGLETARQLVARGFDVLVAARNQADAERAARSVGEGATPVHLDVTSAESTATLAASLSSEPPLDALINNAGVALDGFDVEVAMRTLEVNYRGPIRVTDALLPRLSPTANIVMVSSGMGELSSVSPELREELLDPELEREDLDDVVAMFLEAVRRGTEDLGGWPASAYRVSKAALNAFTRILDRELDPHQRVNAVCPGWVRTRMGGASAARSEAEGASGIVWAATLPPDGPSGGFFRDGKPIPW